MCEICASLRPYAQSCDYEETGVSGADLAGTGTGGSAASLPTYTLDQIAWQLTDGYWEYKGTTARHFNASAGDTLTVDLSALTAAGRALAQQALDVWSSITGLIFEEVGSTSGNTITEGADAAASTATAYTINVGDQFLGNLSAAGDQDFVRVQLQAGQQYTINLAGDGSAGELADPYLRLRDAAGNILAFNDDGGTGFDSRITFTATSTGTYYLDAGSYNNLKAGKYVLDIQAGANAGTAITFDDDQNGAFSSSTTSGGNIISSHVNVSASWLSNYGSSVGSYTFQTYIHEIGHALGLGHAGNYNGSASYSADASYANDSWQMSVMSYFSQSANTSIDASYAYVITPMLADIVAAQNLYGGATNTRTGNTTYGEHSNAGGYLDDFLNISNAVTLTLYDDGGIDTLDLGSRTMAQRIDLNPEAISDINGKTGNLAIARGTIIENAISGSGNDTITGNDAANRIESGAGNDRIYGNDGNDTMLGGSGFDHLFGGNGNDTLYGDNQADNLWGGGGNDLLRGGNGNDRIFGEAGNDVLQGGAGGDALFGQNGNDVLNGSSGNDRLFGGAGFDRLEGGAGNDVLQGNFNWDIFVFSDGFGQDVITDFDALNVFEKIDLAGVGSITDFADLAANHMSQVGADVVIDALGGNTITLQGVNLADLGADDFIF